VNPRSRQNIVLQTYRRAAGLEDAGYRRILRENAGVNSSKSPDLTQSGYDLVMSAIETVLWQRVDLGEVPDPLKTPGSIIRSRNYWRRRNPDPARINSRQIYKIEQVWNDLCRFLPVEKRNAGYFAAIVRKAVARSDVGVSALSSSDARLVVEALKDRLRHAVRNANTQGEHSPGATAEGDMLDPVVVPDFTPQTAPKKS